MIIVRLYSILICLCFILVSDSYSQVQTAYNIGDTVYRYTTELKNETQSFSSINLLYLQFPCVDQLVVSKSVYSNVDYELSKKGYREFYDLDATKLYLVGGEIPDPFLSSNNSAVLYDNKIPMARSSRKDDFFEQSKNGFSFSYDYEELNQELKLLLDEFSAKEIMITGSLQTNHTYKRKDKFDTLYELIEGFVIESDMLYAVKKIELNRVGAWEEIFKGSNEALKQYFGDIKINYLSFYSYESLAEIARIQILPQPKFYYNSDIEIGRFISCNYSGPSIYVYPNPSFGDVKAKFSRAKTGIYEFKISNIIGKPLWSKNLQISRSNQEINIELPGLSKGVYLYKISDPQGKVIQARRLILVEP